jgi:predicted ATPase/serine/threonine protein kinase
MRPLAPGEVIDGFRIVRPLGHGGMGAVYLAHDEALDRPTALKVIKADHPTADLRQRFQTEARALARLNHPNVVSVYRFGDVEGVPYLAYEFIEGEPLDQVPWPVPWKRVLAIGIGLARGVAAAHAQEVLHRDIKPPNIIVMHDGAVKLLDFGLAVLADDLGDAGATTRQTSAGLVPGTPAYVAPERWFGAPASTAADVWALGMVLRTLLTGRHALHGVALVDIPRTVSRADFPAVASEVLGLPAMFGDLVDRCAALHEWRRPPNGGAVLDALLSLQTILASFESPSTPGVSDTVGVVEASFTRVQPRARKLGARFYERLFAAAPELRALFPADMEAQREKLVGALSTLVEHLRDPDTLLPFLRGLGRRHQAYGVVAAHFEPVGDALLGALGELDPDWSPGVEAGWGAAWAQVVRGMVSGMHTASAASETLESLPDAVGLAGGRLPSEGAERSPAAPQSAPASVPGNAPRSAPVSPSTPSTTPSPSTPSPASLPDVSLLPAPITRFFGRVQEVADIDALVAGGARLVTVLGLGGLGKTRLVLEAARHILQSPEAGGFARVGWVPLADARGRDAAVQILLRALGVKEVLGDPMDALVAAMARGRTLLVLDNLEHLVDALADVIATLLERVPGLTCLVTSQRALELFGEAVYRLAPLPLPDPDDAELAHTPALLLFADRARLHRPGFELDGTTVRLVAALARRLDGLPLAIELAAARAGQTDLAALVSRLDSDLGALADRSRNRPDRQRSLVAALRWTSGLLLPERLALFARLSVFPGELDSADVRAVLGPDLHATGPDDIDDALTDLAQTSLLVPLPDAPGRYRALSTVRAYAATLLGEAESAVLRERFRAHFVELALAWSRSLGTPDAAARSARLDRAWPNLMAALEGAPVDMVATVLGSTPVHVLWTGRFAEMLPRFDRFAPIEALAALPPVVRANLIRAGHRLSVVGGDARRAATWRAHVAWCLEEEQLPDLQRRGLESELSITAIDRGCFAEAEAIVERHRRHSEANGLRRALAMNLDSLARIAYFRGDSAQAAERIAAAWAIASEIGDPQLRDVVLVMRATVDIAAGRLADAGATLDEVRDLRRLAGRPVEDGATLVLGVCIALEEGRLDDAWAAAVAGERANRNHGRLRIYCFDLLAQVAFARGDHPRAIAEAERTQAGFAAILRPVELPRTAILRARSLHRLGDPGARAALEAATRSLLAIEGHRGSDKLFDAWREAEPTWEWPAAGTLADGAWRALFDAEGRLLHR